MQCVVSKNSGQPAHQAQSSFFTINTLKDPQIVFVSSKDFNQTVLMRSFI